MAGPGGKSSHSLIEALRNEPYRFDFFWAVRSLQALLPGESRVGYSKLPEQDPLRFGQTPSLHFPSSTIQSVGEGTPTRMDVNFFGLFGPNGPLPVHLTEYAMLRREISDSAKPGDQVAPGSPEDPTLSSFARFCDIFHHRMISLFYRAWECNQKSAGLDRAESDRFALYIGSLFGMADDSLYRRDKVPDAAKLYYSGLLACQTRPAEGLEAIIEDFFGIPTNVETFVGQWLDLPPENVCQLGQSPSNGCLGTTAIAGERIWDCQTRFRIRMGPLDLDDFKRMLPKGPSFERLRAWVFNYAGFEYFWDLQLVLKRREVPQTRLNGGSALGWTSWVRTSPFTRDADDLILRPEEWLT